MAPSSQGEIGMTSCSSSSSHRLQVVTMAPPELQVPDTSPAISFPLSSQLVFSRAAPGDELVLAYQNLFTRHRDPFTKSSMQSTQVLHLSILHLWHHFFLAGLAPVAHWHLMHPQCVCQWASTYTCRPFGKSWIKHPLEIHHLQKCLPLHVMAWMMTIIPEGQLQGWCTLPHSIISYPACTSLVLVTLQPLRLVMSGVWHISKWDPFHTWGMIYYCFP